MVFFPFSKYSGCGNDFILIDNRNNLFPSHHVSLISRLCRRPDGIGADGVILIETSHIADVKMRIFNSDGKEAEMCGNGLRCIMKFLHELGITKSKLDIETMERKLHIESFGDQVKASMGSPKDIKQNISLMIQNKEVIVHYLDTGVPHAIHFVENIEDAPVVELGSKIRFHSFFQPKGANANFVQITGPTSLTIRTYERGVEAETLACGTGATAAALMAHLDKGLVSPIEVKTKSGQNLTISFSVDEKKQFTNVMQSGPATFHFKGSFALTKEELCH